MAKEQEVATVTKATFLKSLEKKKSALVKGAKEQRKTGYMDDAGILMKLGIAEKERKTFPASVSKVVFSFAKGDASRPMFRFSYVINSTDPKAKGTVVANNYILEEKSSNGEVWETEEDAAAKLAGEFQGLGEDTNGWEFGDYVDAAETHTKNKTEISVTVSAYMSGKGELKMNVTPNPMAGQAPADNSDLDDEATDFDPTAWLGYWIEFEHESVDGTVRMKIEEYDADSDTWSGTDENGEAWADDYAIATTSKWEASETQDPE